MDISDLPYPDTSQFEHYGIDKRPSRIYIGREFLKFRYHENPSDDITVTKQNYVDEFFELVEGIELPFQKVYINQSTLTEVAVWLHRNQSELAAEKCLTEAFGESPLIIERQQLLSFSRRLTHLSKILIKIRILENTLTMQQCRKPRLNISSLGTLTSVGSENR